MKKDIKISKKEFVKEHKHLVKVLKNKKKKELDKEAKDQSDELKEVLQKGIKDTSKLEKVPIINKKGKKQNVWKKRYGHLNLHRYPPNEIPESEVKVNTKGNIHSHSVLTWRHPDTGNIIHSYTRERMKERANKKFNRENIFSDEELNGIKKKTDFLINSKKQSDSIKQASAVINIIANTGLRRGERFYTKNTGNKGVLTLSTDEVKINGDKINFVFTGKSCQNNRSYFRNAIVSSYLEKLKQKNNKEEFLFDISTRTLNHFWNRVLKMKDKYLIKDLRTKFANNVAKKILLSKKFDIKGKKKSEQKRIIKEVLKQVFEETSKKLNNTVGMAKSSYVNPELIQSWLKKNKVNKIFNKSQNNEINLFIIEIEK